MTVPGASNAINLLCQTLMIQPSLKNMRNAVVKFCSPSCDRDLEAAADLFEGEDSFHTAQVPGAARALQRFIGHINVQTGAPGHAHLGLDASWHEYKHVL